MCILYKFSVCMLFSFVDECGEKFLSQMLLTARWLEWENGKLAKRVCLLLVVFGTPEFY